jgi:hypothetical protein
MAGFHQDLTEGNEPMRPAQLARILVTSGLILAIGMGFLQVLQVILPIALAVAQSRP